MRINIVVIVSLALIVTGCKKPEKDVYSYYPKVETLGSEVLPDGRIRLTGRVISSGTEELAAVGFCLDTIPGLSIITNQKLSDVVDEHNLFSVEYEQLSSVKNYYFKAFAANGNGYTTGEELIVDHTGIDSSIVPCTLPPDEVIVNGNSESFISIDPLEYSSFGWSFSANSNAHWFQFSFSIYPTSGVYKTFSNTSSAAAIVSIMMDGYMIKDNYKVYVKEIAAGSIELIICDAVLGNGASSNVRLRLKTPS